MRLSRDIVERRAIQAGVKASLAAKQVVSERELLALRVQTMAWWLRIALVVLGVGLVVSGWYGWPLDSSVGQGLEAIGGLVAIWFGAFGIRRALSQVVDSLDSVGSIDLRSTVLDVILQILSNLPR
jgi:hypothetical protein